MRLRIVLPAAALAVGLLGIGFGSAEALSTATIPPNTIHGCVVGKNRTLEQVYTNPASGTVCALGQQVIFPKGAPTTTAGPKGLDVMIVAVNSGTNTGAFALCPADHPYVIGGGFTNGSDGAGIIESRPFTQGGPTGQQQGWDFSGDSAGGSAYAVCAK